MYKGQESLAQGRNVSKYLPVFIFLSTEKGEANIQGKLRTDQNF